MENNNQASSGVRAIVQEFLSERLDSKLEKLEPDDPKYQATQEKFQYENWVTDAARRVVKLQLVTHTLKPIHSAAKGTNLFVLPTSLPSTGQVSTNVLQDDFNVDLVFDTAANLDVYTFLKLKYGGKKLLDMALDGDPAFVGSLNEDHELAQEQADAFASIVEAKGQDASSTLAKQLYWLVGKNAADDGHYHLLAPLYPTSLVHRVYLTIQEHRFNEETKEARKARWENRYSEIEYHDYPKMAVQNIGGANTQNVSQLNAERRGTNYLLASLPPQWRSNPINPPKHTDSIFPRFGRQREVRWTVRGLLKLLEGNPPVNMKTRDRVDGFVNSLVDELVIYAARFARLEPGWSSDQDCQLAEPEKLWLDGWRGKSDVEFRALRERWEWPEQVTDRFAKWLNHQLKGLPVGDSEHREWMSHINRRLNVFKEVLHG